ncbi:MAG: two-component sensor histidine kinase [Hymenobacteraceae bacterium]|nr:two-component sensor histidine kinase [Hymenobacteraceae bacterium]
MKLSSRTLAVAVAALVAVAIGVFLVVAPAMTFQQMWLALGLTAGGCFILIYFTYEALLFREVNNIYSELEHIKRKEFRKMSNKFLFRPDPLKRMKDEILYTAIQRQKELEELKHLQDLRSEFLADVSHELKTPLFAAQGFIHTLLDGAVDDVQVRDKFLLRAATALDGLDDLVKDLISISQLEKGVAKMDKRNFDLTALVHEIFDQLEQPAATRHATLTLHPPNPGPVWVYADRGRIRQVLMNLLDNAIKYGQFSGGLVRVSMREAKRQQIDITVADDGPGIARAHQTRIFERFYRVDKSRARADTAGGPTSTGLGLAISKHIVEAHKSTISVRSEVGRGTEMRFRLPRARLAGSGIPLPVSTLPAAAPDPGTDAADAPREEIVSDLRGPEFRASSTGALLPAIHEAPTARRPDSV